MEHHGASIKINFLISLLTLYYHTRR